MNDNTMLIQLTNQNAIIAATALTWRRLGAAAAFTKRSAGYFRSCSHVTFCGVTAAVAPNRSLAAGVLVVTFYSL